MKDEKSPKKIRGKISVAIITFIIFSLGFLPTVIGGYYILFFISFNEFWHLFFIPFIIYIGLVATVFYQLLFSGFIIYLFNIKYKEGTFDYTFANKMAYKWIVLSSLYTPIRNILEIIPISKGKYFYYRMLGMKIGKNTLVGGTIMDPCLTEIGDNCTMGLFACIYGHIHDYEKGIIILDRIKVGNNCIIGAGSYIMPGAVLEDNVKLAAGSVVTKGQVLKKGKVYGGIPAKEIKSKSMKK